MGVIQSSVNQAINTAGLFAGMSPELQARAAERRELASINKQKPIIKQRLESEIAEQEVQKRTGHLPTEADIRIHRETGGQLEDVIRRQFELRPSQEGYQQYRAVKSHNLSYDQQLERMANERVITSSKARKGQTQALNNRFDWSKMSVEQRAAFLKEGQHIQSQEKRRVQHEAYEEGKK